MAGPLLLARHWPLATRCRISGRRNPVRPSELDPQGRSRRPVSHAGCPSTSSEAAGGALLRFTPRPRSAPRSAARFPLAGASVPVSAIESCEHRKRTCTAGGDLHPDLRHRAARSLPSSGPRRTTSRSPSLTPRSKQTAPSWAILCADSPPAASWSTLPCRNRLPFRCRSQHESRTWQFRPKTRLTRQHLSSTTYAPVAISVNRVPPRFSPALQVRDSHVPAIFNTRDRLRFQVHWAGTRQTH